MIAMTDSMRAPKDRYDVIVVGSGASGLASAVAAAEAGLSVAIFEKDALLGGGTALSAGGLWAGCNHVQRAHGISDSKDAVMQYVRFIAGGEADESVLSAFVDASPIALEFFDRCGVKMQLVPSFPDHYFPVAPGSISIGRTLEASPVSIAELGEWAGKLRDSHIDPHRVSVEEFVSSGGLVNRRNRDQRLIAERNEKGIRTCGLALVAHLLKAYLARGGPVFLGLGVDRLLHDGNGVNGIRTSNGQGIVATRAVVLATGGWEGDPELAKSFEGLPGLRSAFPKCVSGDGIRLACDAGAATALIRNNLAIILGFDVPAKTSQQETEFRHSQVRECACPHNIIVNSQGRRFADESYFPESTAALRRYDVWTRRHINLPAFLIFDCQFVENFAFAGGEPGEIPPEWVSRANSIEELARILGISEAGLCDTVQRFNGFAREGVDADFRRGEKRWKQANPDVIQTGNASNRALGTIEKPPFYGLRMSPAPVVPSGGIRTNRHGQVVDTYGVPIPRLYGVGNVAAHREFGVGYQAGLSLTSALTFGYLSIEHARQNVPSP
jgi:3-oxosteroid 1-dehydrogenase